MIEQQCLADKILAELPCELAAATTFKVDEKERLCMFFSFKLAGPDFQVVLDVVKRYQGDFVNQKEDGRDVGFFMFPKPKPKEEVKPAADLVPPAAQAKEEKPLEALKQSSPMEILKARFCELCPRRALKLKTSFFDKDCPGLLTKMNILPIILSAV